MSRGVGFWRWLANGRCHLPERRRSQSMQLHDRLCGQCTLWRKNSTKWIRNMTCCTVNCPFVVSKIIVLFYLCVCNDNILTARGQNNKQPFPYWLQYTNTIMHIYYKYFILSCSSDNFANYQCQFHPHIHPVCAHLHRSDRKLHWAACACICNTCQMLSREVFLLLLI